MHLALSPQHDVVGALVLDHGQRGILLVEPQQRLAELDVVLAVGGRNRKRQHRRRRLGLDQRLRRGLAVADGIAGLDRIDLGERNRVAGFRAGALRVMRAADAKDGRDSSRTTR